MNTPLNFKISKLLKEKGFDCITKNYYTPNSGNFVHGLINVVNPIRVKAAPISEVVMWLYEKHGIWIEVVLERPNHFTYEISRVENQEILNNIYSNYDSPTEAYEAAIEYTLKNLI